MVAETQRGEFPLKDKLFPVYLTGATFQGISPLDIADKITSTPGIIH